MKIRISRLSEPKLQFGNGGKGSEPKLALKSFGPLDRQDSPEVIRLGLVGRDRDVSRAAVWIERLNHPLLASEGNSRRFRDFPGAPQALATRFVVEKRFVRSLDESRYNLAINDKSKVRTFDDLLDLYDRAISSLFVDAAPACILVCFPEEVATLRIANPRLTENERNALERLQAEEESAQLSLFDATPEELALAAELRPQAEELLFRNFYRALKARVMSHPNAVPIQVLRTHTFVEEEAKQSPATRAWNLGVSLLYKAGRIPWRPLGIPEDTCFVGISFHHLKRRAGDIVYASVAQAFASSIDPFALKGASIPPDQRRNFSPYLTEAQAQELMLRVIAEYEARVGIPPSRVVVHKTSRYQPEEQSGFQAAALDRVSACELVWMNAGTSFRLLRRGMQEPWRGTLCKIGSDEHYLFTTGYVPYWDEYPGPHIPAPLQIGSVGDGDINERANEILALTKMNWNSAEGMSRDPITISFAKRVGVIMSELQDGQEPNPSYRFYM